MINYPIKQANNRLGNPWHEVERFQREMDHIFDLTFPGVMNGGDALVRGEWFPTLELIDEENQVLVMMDLPGLKKNDIRIMVEETCLTVQGERKRDKRFKIQDYVKSERSFGAFSRRLRLPASIETNRVKATFRDGVLELILPKKEDHRPKNIEIQIE